MIKCCVSLRLMKSNILVCLFTCNFFFFFFFFFVFYPQLLLRQGNLLVMIVFWFIDLHDVRVKLFFNF